MSNPLALAFLEGQSRSELADWNENKTPFIDDGIIQDIDYEDINIVFTLDRECKNSTVRDADNHMSYLEGESGSYNRLSDDVYQYNDDSSFKDDLSRFIDDYFESHKDSISYLSYNFSSLDKFKEYFKDVVSTERSTYYDKIKDKYIDKMYDLTYPVYQSQVEDELNAVKEYYTIESYYAGSQEIKFNLYEFAKFLEEQEITQITDFCDLFENYIDYSGINYDDYYIDIDYQYPETDSIIEEYLNEFIENEFDDIENQSSEVRETRLELMKLLSKYQMLTLEKLEENPYRLIDDIEGIGFIKADEIAYKLGIQKDDMRRIKAAIIYAMQYIGYQNGDLFLTDEQTSNLVSGRYVYDVELDNGTDVSRILEGIITVTPQVTR
jgi:DNA repair photolyase